MRTEKDSDEPVTYNIEDVKQTFDKLSLQYILLGTPLRMQYDFSDI